MPLGVATWLRTFCHFGLGFDLGVLVFKCTFSAQPIPPKYTDIARRLVWTHEFMVVPYSFFMLSDIATSGAAQKKEPPPSDSSPHKMEETLRRNECGLGGGDWFFPGNSIPASTNKVGQQPGLGNAFLSMFGHEVKFRGYRTSHPFLTCQ